MYAFFAIVGGAIDSSPAAISPAAIIDRMILMMFPSS